MWTTVFRVLKALMRILPLLQLEVQRIRCQECEQGDFELILAKVKDEGSHRTVEQILAEHGDPSMRAGQSKRPRSSHLP